MFTFSPVFFCTAKDRYAASLLLHDILFCQKALAIYENSFLSRKYPALESLYARNEVTLTLVRHSDLWLRL